MSTGIPAFFPSVRNVFVAPALPLPYSRTSMPYRDLPIHTADGIDPIRYAVIMAKTVALFIKNVLLFKSKI